MASGERFTTTRFVKTTRYLGAVYRAELAAELQRAGYSIRPGREGFFELAHIDRAQLAAFSQRAEQIERGLADAGLTLDGATSEQKQRVWRDTRRRKAPTDRRPSPPSGRPGPALSGSTSRSGRARLDGGADPVTAPSSTAAAAHVAAEGARRSVRFAIAHLTERQAIMEERELLDVALKHAVGRAKLRDIEREVDRQKRCRVPHPREPSVPGRRPSFQRAAKASERLDLGPSPAGHGARCRPSARRPGHRRGAARRG